MQRKNVKYFELTDNERQTYDTILKLISKEVRGTLGDFDYDYSNHFLSKAYDLVEGKKLSNITSMLDATTRLHCKVSLYDKLEETWGNNPSNNQIIGMYYIIRLESAGRYREAHQNS